MKRFYVLPLIAAALVSCAGNQGAKEAKEDQAEAQEVKELSLDGKWRLSDYAGGAQIETMDSTQDYYLTLNMADSTFGMSTDCNSLGGEIKLVGDSLTFDNIAMTQMACPNDSVEVAMKTILPMITTYTVADSTLILRSDARIMATFSYVKD